MLHADHTIPASEQHEPTTLTNEAPEKSPSPLTRANRSSPAPGHLRRPCPPPPPPGSSRLPSQQVWPSVLAGPHAAPPPGRSERWTVQHQNINRTDVSTRGDDIIGQGQRIGSRSNAIKHRATETAIKQVSTTLQAQTTPAYTCR